MSTIVVTPCSENVECKFYKKKHISQFKLVAIYANWRGLYIELSTNYINASLFTFIIKVVIVIVTNVLVYCVFIFNIFNSDSELIHLKM
jgi:hypothetical protein